MKKVAIIAVVLIAFLGLTSCRSSKGGCQYSKVKTMKQLDQAINANNEIACLEE